MTWVLSILARFVPTFLPAIGPLLNPWVLVAFLVYTAAVAGFSGFKCYELGVSKLHEYIAEQAIEAVKLTKRQAAATERVVVKYVKVKGETEVVTRTVEKEVVRYADRNPGMCLDTDWRLLHDAAAANTVPGRPGGLHDPGRAPPPAPTGDRRPEGR